MKIILIGIAIIGLVGIIGCSSSHKHCGTAHYSTATSQDFENMKRRGETNEFLLNRSLCDE